MYRNLSHDENSFRDEFVMTALGCKFSTVRTYYAQNRKNKGFAIVCFDTPIFFLGVERSKQHKHRYLYPGNSSETIAFMEGAGMPSATPPPPL